MKHLLEEIARHREREQRLVEVTALLCEQIDLSTLLEKIVSSLRSVTSSDAGSLFLVEGGTNLRFAVAQNDSVAIPFQSFVISISSRSIAGYVAQTGEVLRIQDAYHIDPAKPYKFNGGVDMQFGYRTRSILTVPMRNQQNKIVGVLQLINKKKRSDARILSEADADEHVESYSDDDDHFLNILSAQAAIAVERASLYDGIERLLRGVIESSAAAIESRDKTTAGHSQRIAAYMVVMAKRINQQKNGFWKDIKFTNDDIRALFCAAMLHDIGKIGVRENVLIKANKLTDEKMEAIRMRIALQIVREPAKKDEWMNILDFIKGVNIPGFLDDAKFARLQEIGATTIRDVDGSERALLDNYEMENLSVRRGNLTNDERKEIESHVVHSLEILQKIPWTDDLKRVPIIAGTHHEKLNGKGYPKGLTKDEIPFEGRMLAVVDVFEALTAMDRPYKPASPIPKALDILRAEAKSGGLQEEIVEFFAEQKIWEVISDEQRRNFTLRSDEILALN